MSEQAKGVSPARSFWIIAMLSLIWNIIGVMNFVYSVTLGPDAASTRNARFDLSSCSDCGG